MPRAQFIRFSKNQVSTTLVPMMLVAVALTIPPQVCGQEQELAQIYSDGVHAFFKQDANLAKQHLDSAISYGSRDPRVYYFRALAQHCLGDTVAFEEDVRAAAELEIRGSGTYDIGRSLERIQGTTRLELERIRREVHLTLAKQRPAQPSTNGGTGTGQPNLVPDFGRQLPAEETDPFEDDTETKMDELPADKAETGTAEPGTEKPADADSPSDTASEGTDAADDAGSMDDSGDFGTDTAEPTPEVAPQPPVPAGDLESTPEASSEDNPFDTEAPADDAVGEPTTAGPPAVGPPAPADAANPAEAAAGGEGTNDLFENENPFDEKPSP